MKTRLKDWQLYNDVIIIELDIATYSQFLPCGNSTNFQFYSNKKTVETKISVKVGILIIC